MPRGTLSCWSTALLHHRSWCPAEVQEPQHRCPSHVQVPDKTHTCALDTPAQRAVPALGAAGSCWNQAPHAWHISRAEETQPILLFISCYFCYLEPSFYFQCKGISPSPLLGLNQDSLWNFTLIPSQILRLNIYFYESMLLQWYDLVPHYIRIYNYIGIYKDII